MTTLKRQDICIYIGKDFCGLEYGTLVEVLGMDDNGTYMIVYFGFNDLILPRGVLPQELVKIDHISQKWASFNAL
jgi:hypothetical protein